MEATPVKRPNGEVSMLTLGILIEPNYTGGIRTGSKPSKKSKKSKKGSQTACDGEERPPRKRRRVANTDTDVHRAGT